MATDRLLAILLPPILESARSWRLEILDGAERMLVSLPIAAANQEGLGVRVTTARTPAIRQGQAARFVIRDRDGEALEQGTAGPVGSGSQLELDHVAFDFGSPVAVSGVIGFAP